MEPRHPLHPQTASIAEGFDPALSVMAVRPPIYPVSTYAFQDAASAARMFEVALGKTAAATGEDLGLIYARLNHPNAQMFEEALCAVEKGAKAALAFSSGMAAITTTLMTLLRPGDVLLYQRPVYGGTDHFFRQMLPQWGVSAVPVCEGQWQQALEVHRERVAVVYLETPANPTLRMIDLAAVATLVRLANTARGALVVVDNTFLGPVFQSPLEHGADLALYSATKFLGGHSDLVAGAVAGKDQELIGKVNGTRAFLGTICEPFTAWMLQRSMATLWLRMVKQSKNAKRLIDTLRLHPAVARVHYPTLFDGEQARIYKRQCSAPGSMLAIELHGGREAAFAFLNNLRVIRLAVSLGGVESLACHPRTTTASEMSPEDLAAGGVSEGLVRVSVGVEYWKDLEAELARALDAALLATRSA